MGDDFHSEIIWYMGNWRTEKFDSFLQEVDADVYFIPIYNVVYMAMIQQHVLKKKPKPYVCYLWDDNFSYKACGRNPFAYLHRFLLRKCVRKLAENCTEMFTITKTQAIETDKLFGTHSIVLTKGIDYSKLVYEEKAVNTPIKMVYTGNLLIGRASSLVAISKALANINRDEIKIELDIYSPTVLAGKTVEYLNANGCHYLGSVPKSEVAAIQRNADIVVFVESLEKEHRYAARLSFSTKLTDYFASGKCIFAIGDETIAPIEYLIENDAALICTDYSEVEGKLREIAAAPDLISAYGKKAFDCGKRNHEQSLVKQTFVDTLCRAAEKGKKDGRQSTNYR